MTLVEIYFSLDKILDLVRELRREEIVFEWEYRQSVSSLFGCKPTYIESHAVFKFKDAGEAMLFQLKYGSSND
jgi:hypothetical protein